jgi:hypothetical protein
LTCFGLNSCLSKGLRWKTTQSRYNPIGLAYGWAKAKDWNLQTVMLVYTIALVLWVALGGYNYATVAVPR